MTCPGSCGLLVAQIILIGPLPWSVQLQREGSEVVLQGWQRFTFQAIMDFAGAEGLSLLGGYPPPRPQQREKLNKLQAAQLLL